MMFTCVFVASGDIEQAQDAPTVGRALVERLNSDLVLVQVATWLTYLFGVPEALSRRAARRPREMRSRR